MDSPGSKPENEKTETVSIAKTRLYLAIAVVVLAFVAFILYFTHTPSTRPEDKKPEPALRRDEPVQKQILQEDYKEKVKEMLDSGKSVNEVSKDTRIRKDEIRKIKKESKQKEAK